LYGGNPTKIKIDCDGTRCEHCNKVVNPEKVGYGNIAVGLVGEAPFKEEVELGRPFVGNSGLQLRKYLDLDNYVYFIMNSVNCLTYVDENILKPSDMVLDVYEERKEMCRQFRERVLDLLDDRSVIMLFGRFAKLAMLGANIPNSPFPRELKYKDKIFYVFTNYHPAYLLYRPSSREVFEDILDSSGVFLKDVMETDL
jgi:uracil-DNA glycosylase family 4